MIEIEYIGTKEGGERAFMEKTGIEWQIGDVKEVKEEHAAEMLKHGDIFRPTEASKEAAEKLVPALVQLRATHLPESEEEDDHKNDAQNKAREVAKAAKPAGKKK